MFVLPRGKTVKEQLDPARLKMPDALLKMCANEFSGYLAIDGPESHGVICYEAGRITSALWLKQTAHLTAGAAIEQMFRMIQSQSCTLGIYRLEQPLAALVRMTCEGQLEFEQQAMTLVDVDRLLDRLEQSRFSGALRLQAAEQVAMIFYRSGEPLGFFHDAHSELQLEVPLSQSLAALEHCRLDVIRFSAANDSEPRGIAINLEQAWLKIWRELNP